MTLTTQEVAHSLLAQDNTQSRHESHQSTNPQLSQDVIRRVPQDQESWRPTNSQLSQDLIRRPQNRQLTDRLFSELERYLQGERNNFSERRVNELIQRLIRGANDDEMTIDPSVLSEVHRLLHLLPPLPEDAEVSLDSDGVVAIEVARPPNGAFGLFCEPGNRAFCVVYAGNSSRRARYSDSHILPDGFVEEGLRAVLERQG